MNKPIRLLIVDDSRIICRAIERYLQAFEIEVVGYALDGQQALEMFKAHRPDVVTLDITMPKLNGLKVLKEIRKGDGMVRILLVTALSDEETSRKAMALGAQGIVLKPFTAEKLSRAFGQVIETKPWEPPAND